ncbi:hypothetical protein BEI60_25020 [Eisenbergiella tayi]|nr:hypothetical protein BEI60_25020 [Eisenbergiella tayi]
MDPYRGRFRSDNHAAVLRLQNTQPKDRRAYNAPYRNPCMALPGKGAEGPFEQGTQITAGADAGAKVV